MDDLPSGPKYAADLEELTRAYARYACSAGGLAAVAGGVLCIASYLLGGLLPPGAGVHGTLILIPLAWLLGKQYMASIYYQRFGRAEERETANEYNIRRMFVGFTVAACFVVGAGLIAGLQPIGNARWGIGSIANLLVIVSMPWVVWRWLRSPLDFVVGVFLLCQAALALRGETYALWSSAAVFPVAAAAMILGGIRDHLAFLRVERRIRQLRASQQATG